MVAVRPAPAQSPAGLQGPGLPHICPGGQSPAAETRCSGSSQRAQGGWWCSRTHTGASASACRTRGLQRTTQQPRSERLAGVLGCHPPALRQRPGETNHYVPRSDRAAFGALGPLVRKLPVCQRPRGAPGNGRRHGWLLMACAQGFLGRGSKSRRKR